MKRFATLLAPPSGDVIMQHCIAAIRDIIHTLPIYWGFSRPIILNSVITMCILDHAGIDSKIILSAVSQQPETIAITC